MLERIQWIQLNNQVSYLLTLRFTRECENTWDSIPVMGLDPVIRVFEFKAAQVD